MIQSLRLLAMVHFIANAVLLGLGYYWLGLGEARASTLAWSAFVAVAIVCLACWAYASALIYFGQTRHCAVDSWLTALRNLFPLAIAAVAVAVIYYLLARWAAYSPGPASQLASWLTLKLRKPVKPAAVLRYFNVVLWVVRWVIVPVLLLPMLSAIASHGWRGFSGVGALARKWLYWIEAPLLLLCTLALPLKLLGWVPQFSGFGVETLSFFLRAATAYLLFVTAWLALAFVTSGGTPRFTQAKTVDSP
jgi:hypothetical protein